MIFALCVALPACRPAASADSSPPAADGFDAKLARELGADRYGMRQYVIAFLKSGPNQPASPEAARELQAGHMANIRRMAAAGQLVLAGPFMDDGELRGIYLFAVATIEEARALTATDPAIQAGTLVMELRPWYGSAALMRTNAVHGRIAAENP